MTRALSNYAESNNKHTYDYNETNKLNILILRIHRNGLYYNYFFMADLIILEKFDFLHIALL